MQGCGQPHGGLHECGRFRILVQYQRKGLLCRRIAALGHLRLPQGRKTLRHAGIIGIPAIQSRQIATGVHQIAYIDVSQPQTQQGVGHARRTQVGVHGLAGGGHNGLKARQGIVDVTGPKAVTDVVEGRLPLLRRQVGQVADLLQLGQGLIILALLQQALSFGQHFGRICRFGHGIALLVHIDDRTRRFCSRRFLFFRCFFG